MNTVNWETLSRQNFVFENECWLTCGGGHCCSTDHPDFKFDFLPTKGTTLLYMEAEYEWQKVNGLILHDPVHTVSLNFGGKNPLKVLNTPCHLLGQCEGIVSKPLLCKLYPFLPILSLSGELEDIIPASIFDFNFSLINGQETPCTVWGKRGYYMEMWRKNTEILELLNTPYIIFYLRAAYHFANSYRTKFKNFSNKTGLSGVEFWKKWEFRYLSGALIDKVTLTENIHKDYKALIHIYGDFGI